MTSKAQYDTKTNKIILSEHEEQVLVIEWANLYRHKRLDDFLVEYLLAIPNGGHRHIGVAIKLKKEGVKKGVSDLFLAVPSEHYFGLWVEMKPCGATRSSIRPDQRKFLQLMNDMGYYATMCAGFENAKRVICQYLDDVFF